MDWVDFVSLMKYMNDTFGVAYGYFDEEEDLDLELELPTREEDCESAWFLCDECGEPIYYADWKDEFGSFEFAPDGICCPICGSPWTEAIYEDDSDGYIIFKDGPEVVFGDTEEE